MLKKESQIIDKICQENQDFRELKQNTKKILKQIYFTSLIEREFTKWPRTPLWNELYTSVVKAANTNFVGNHWEGKYTDN